MRQGSARRGGLGRSGEKVVVYEVVHKRRDGEGFFDELLLSVVIVYVCIYARFFPREKLPLVGTSGFLILGAFLSCCQLYVLLLLLLSCLLCNYMHYLAIIILLHLFSTGEVHLYVFWLCV